MKRRHLVPLAWLLLAAAVLHFIGSLKKADVARKRASAAVAQSASEAIRQSAKFIKLRGVHRGFFCLRLKKSKRIPCRKITFGLIDALQFGMRYPIYVAHGIPAKRRATHVADSVL